MGYPFRLAASVLLYAPSHRQDSTYNGLCYTSSGTLAGTRMLRLTTPLQYFDLVIFMTHNKEDIFGREMWLNHLDSTRNLYCCFYAKL